MKKVLAMTLVASLTFLFAACTKTVTETITETVTETVVVEVPAENTDPTGTLIVGTTDFSGGFIPGFGNSSYDVDVRTLTMGLDVVAFTKDNQFVINETVVADYEVSVDEDGNKTYTYTINEGLMFADGSEIMAEDYVFYVEWMASQAYKLAGASTTTGAELVGYPEWKAGCYFVEGTTDCDPDHDYEAEPLEFAGVQLLGDYSFSLTVSADELPYYYELTMFAAIPANKDFFTQNGTLEIVGTEKAEDGTVGSKEFGDYTAEFTDKVPASAFSGPYYLVEYIPGQSVKLRHNEYYPGDYRGHTPKIDKLVLKVIPSATDMESLLAGDVDLITGLVEGDKIDQGREAEGIERSHYPRNGFGAIFFHADFGPTAEVEVRQALAYMVDKAQFVEAFTGGYAEIVQGPYGLSQWMYKEAGGEDWVANDLINYTYSIDKANEMLDASTWKYNVDGDMWTTAQLDADDPYRYNADGERLVINWLGMADTEYQELLKPILLKGTAATGINFYAETGDWPTLLNEYYYASSTNPDRKYHMFNLATNFGTAFDPYWSYHSDFYDQWMNSVQLLDDEIDALTIEMRQAASNEEFLAAWEQFQVRMNYLSPMVPLYSNDYHDFFNEKLHGLETDSMWDWPNAIIDAWIEE